MKLPTIFLEATEEKDHLKIGLHAPGDVIWQYETLDAPMERITLRCRQILEQMSLVSRNGGGGTIAYDQLRSVGRMLADELLPTSVKEQILITDAQYLILKLDDHLAHIPWELLCVGNELLGQRFCVGRSIITRQKLAKVQHRSLKRPLKMWIVANPGGDLEVADSEGLRIFRDMARMNGNQEIISPCLDTEITAQQLREAIKDYDFVHFAGHVDYHWDTPENTGWRMADGHFTVKDVDRIAGGTPMPALVFSNACQSARTAPVNWDDTDVSAGLPNAFLRAGVKHYVGTSWEVMDEPSSYFAFEFYRLLREGQTVGQAVRGARRMMTETYGPDICWASYVLYGDPTVRYFRSDSDDPTVSDDSHGANSIDAPKRLTRGGWLGSSWNLDSFTGVRQVLLIGIMLLVLALTGMALIFGNRYIHQTQARWDDEQRNRIRQMLVERAEKQQARTERLFQQLALLCQSLPETGNTVTQTLTLATVFDNNTMAGGQERMILHCIQDQIIQSRSRFRLLEQDSFDLVLEELIRSIQLTPPEQRVRPNVLMPRIILIVQVHDTGEKILVLMRLVDRNTRMILDTLFAELNRQQPVLKQKERLARQLIQKLKEYETRGTV